MLGQLPDNNLRFARLSLVAAQIAGGGLTDWQPDELMARWIIAGSEFYLMPSRFKPCGLMRMQAQRYGALPIAHATGGLADTIEDEVTGFLLSPFSVDGLFNACKRSFAAFADAEQLVGMWRAEIWPPHPEARSRDQAKFA